jgi:hypothetical protein
MIMESRLHLQARGLIRGVSLRQIRLVCGLVLFTYLISHFLNHALGNISMDALAAGVRYHTMFWRFLPVAIVFYSAALVHAGCRGALPTPAIPLESNRAAAARTWPEYPGAHHRPHHRGTDRPGRFRT